MDPADLALRSRLGEGKVDRLRRTARRGDGEAEDARLRAAAQDFESVFLHQLVKMMRSTVEKSGLISGGRAEEIFQDMLDEKYAATLGKNSRIGLADLIYEELKKKNK